jgi:hypothetical protein
MVFDNRKTNITIQKIIDLYYRVFYKKDCPYHVPRADTSRRNNHG